jgi:hypothetical protein
MLRRCCDASLATSQSVSWVKSGRVAVVQQFLDVSLDRPLCPLTLERQPDAVWSRGTNGCVTITELGENVGFRVHGG